MPRYVILEHDYPTRHWDFMLEAGDILRTWKLPAPPQPEQTISAEASFDHRRIYLDYEGPISGGRGCVVRWDNGSFEWVVDEPDALTVRLDGNRLQALASLTRTLADQWSLLIHQGGTDVGHPIGPRP
jgi:hypothetical protein